jgi:hypothetical protein
MSDNLELESKYHEREMRWNNKTLNELSFLNNLILTLSVGFLAFSYKTELLKNAHFAIKDINWSITLIIFSLFAIVFSILIGLIVSINRLIDFRLTRFINLIRYRMIKHASKKLDESTPEKFGRVKRFFLPLPFILKFPRITIEECKKFKDLSSNEKKMILDKFKLLRKITFNLGYSTWRKTLLQILLFAVSILLYLLAQF